MKFPLIQPVLQISFFVTMWDTPKETSVESVLTAVGTGVLNAAVSFLAGGFSEIEGLDAAAEIETYNMGGQNDRVLRFFKRAQYPKLVLKRGVTFNTDIWDWHHQVTVGKEKVRKSGTIILLDQRRINFVPGIDLPFEQFPVAGWTFSNALPEKLDGPTLNAGANGVAIESLEMSVEKLERLSLSLIPGVADLNSAVSALVGIGGAAALGGAAAVVAAVG